MWGRTHLGDPARRSPAEHLERLTCGTPSGEIHLRIPPGTAARGGLAAGLGCPGRAVPAWDPRDGCSDPRGFVSCQLMHVLPPQNPDITITDNVLHFRGRGSIGGSQPGPHPVLPLSQLSPSWGAWFPSVTGTIVLGMFRSATVPPTALCVPVCSVLCCNHNRPYLI